MKFLRTIILTTLVILQLIKETFSKKKWSGHPSQSTRNYRKFHSDPSFNPLPATWTSGPRVNFANFIPKKYKAYNDKLNGVHHWTDTTQGMMKVAQGNHRQRK
jgi:hypothetical protein